MRDEDADFRGWLATLTRAATGLLDEIVGANPWLAGPAGTARPTLVAIGVSTVDRERASAALDRGAWRPLERDPLLGATASMLEVEGRGAPSAEEPHVLLLEPDTEGLLAASLARFGEGLAAIYVMPAGPTGSGHGPGRQAASGPLGPAQLLPGPAWGPHLVVLRSAATIGR